MKIKDTLIETRIDEKIRSIRLKFINETTVRLTCRKALLSAQKKHLTKLKLPAIGVDQGFGIVGCAKIMTQEVMKFLYLNKTSLKKVTFCVSESKDLPVFQKTSFGYIHHFQEKFRFGPFVMADAIIELKKGIIVIERSNPPYGWALPGGFVDYGETIEQAACREAKEETNMTVRNPKLLGIYSDPNRDPRFHSVGAVYVGKGVGKPRSGDDAKGLKVVAYKDLLKLNYAFDHRTIIRDYLRQRK